MARLHETVAALLCVSLVMAPAWGAPSSSLGTIIYADRAHVGAAVASVGATVFGGDRLATEKTGAVQVRAGAARLLLSGESIAMLERDEDNPSARLTLGTATFSTANSKAFSLHVASATIRPNTDDPTIGRVTVLGPKELLVKSARGSLTVAVDDDVRVIPQGAAYRIVLDSNAAVAEPQGPRGAGTPIKAAKSKFIWYAVGVAGLVTYFAVSEAMESPDRP